MTELWALERAERDLVDREGWGPGPWEGEPDIELWRTGGYACLVARHPHFGCLNGYVGLPPTHSLYGEPVTEFRGFRAHGGITFAGRLDQRFCKGDLWWLGFDCGHAFDIAPAIMARCPELRDLPAISLGNGHVLQHAYRTVGYVRAELRRVLEAVQRYPSRRRLSRRAAAKRLARIKRCTRKELVRLAGAREPVGFARAILWELDTLPVRVSVPRSYRPKRKPWKSPLN